MDLTSTSPDLEDRVAPVAPVAVEAARIARAEERLAALSELRELGMALARAVVRPAVEAAEAESDPPSTAGRSPRLDPAEAFARLSRAVRLTVALEAKADAALTALRAGEAVAAAVSRPAAAPGSQDDVDDLDDYLNPPPFDHPSAHRNRLRDAVFQAINREVNDLGQSVEMLDALYERLTEGERYDDLLYRPFKATVAAICKDLGLHPDWSDWTGEGWPPVPPGVPHRAWHRMWAPTRRPKPKLQ